MYPRRYNQQKKEENLRFFYLFITNREENLFKNFSLNSAFLFVLYVDTL